jgi:hypothetical protein
MLAPHEKQLLAHCTLPFVLKQHAFDDIENDLLTEATSFFSSQEEVFVRGAVGPVEQTIVGAHRGDLRCWVTPNLCKTNNLSMIQTLVKRMMSWCKDAKQALHLNGDYSVQLACYVQ